MFCKKMTYWLLSGLLLFSGRNADATISSKINDALDKVNLNIEKIGTVQEDYTSAANGFINGKLGSIGDVNAIAKAAKKAEKLKKKAEKAKKLAEKAKAKADKAKKYADKAKKAADKAKSAKEKLDKKIAKAQNVANKAKDKIDKAKDFANDVKDKANEVKGYMDDAKSMYNDGMSAVNDAKSFVKDAKATASDLKGAASGAAALAQSKTSSLTGRLPFGSDESSTNMSIIPGASSNDTALEYIQPSAGELGSASAMPITPLPSMEASASPESTVAAMSDLAVVDPVALGSNLPTASISGASLSAASVDAGEVLTTARQLSAAGATAASEPIMKSAVSLEDQLTADSSELIKNQPVRVDGLLQSGETASAVTKTEPSVEPQDDLLQAAKKSAASHENFMKRLQEKDAAKAGETIKDTEGQTEDEGNKAAQPQGMSNEEFAALLKAKDEAKKNAPPSEFVYSNEELQQNLAAKDEAKRASLGIKSSSRRAFGRRATGDNHE